MIRAYTLLLLLGSDLRERGDLARRRIAARLVDDEGASTVEYILIALLGIAIAGIVATAITTYVRGKTGQLK